MQPPGEEGGGTSCSPLGAPRPEPGWVGGAQQPPASLWRCGGEGPAPMGTLLYTIIVQYFGGGVGWQVYGRCGRVSMGVLFLKSQFAHRAWVRATPQIISHSLPQPPRLV